MVFDCAPDLLGNIVGKFLVTTTFSRIFGFLAVTKNLPQYFVVTPHTEGIYFSLAINRDSYLLGHRCSQKKSDTKNFKILHDDE